MRLNLLLKLQVVFAATSLAYLLLSTIRQQVTGAPLSAAPLLPSILMFVAYLASLLLPGRGHIGAYRTAMLVAIVLFGGGGVIANVLRYIDGGADQYASAFAWLTAVAINAYGTVLNIVAALGRFTTPEK